jgi:deazaflavin-dependent oxidoreductase (nitroreductase family)
MSDPNDWNATIIEEFRANEGRVGGNFEGAPLLLLHTVGAKSGTPRINPIMYQQVGDDLAVFASAAGSDKHPDWFHNLVAHPDVRVEVGTDTVEMRARITDGDERRSIWETQKERYPGFAEYEAATDREIPVVILERRA